MEFERNRGPRMGRGPIPVKEGDTYDVTIEGIGEKGDGIAKINGYVIIVPQVKKGDRVKVRVNAVRGKVSFGEVVGEAAPEEKTEENQDEIGNDGEIEGSETDEPEDEEPVDDASEEEQ